MNRRVGSCRFSVIAHGFAFIGNVCFRGANVDGFMVKFDVYGQQNPYGESRVATRAGTQVSLNTSSYENARRRLTTTVVGKRGGGKKGGQESYSRSGTLDS